MDQIRYFIANPQDDPELKHAFDLLEVGNHLNEAIEAFRRLLVRPDRGAALFGLAMAFRGLKSYVQSLDYFEQARAQLPHNGPIRFEQCTTYLRLNQVDKANEILDALAQWADADWTPTTAWSAFTFCQKQIAQGSSSKVVLDHAQLLMRLMRMADDGGQDLAAVRLKPLLASLIALSQNEIAWAVQALDTALAPPFPLEHLPILSKLLGQQRIGRVSGSNVHLYLLRLRSLLYACATSNPESCTNMALVELVVLIRDRRTFATLFEQGLNLRDAKASMIEGLLYTEPELVVSLLKAWRPRPKETQSAFYYLCAQGMFLKDPYNQESLDSIFSSDFFNSIGSFDEGNLLGQLHQFCFSLVSSGQLQYGRRMVLVLSRLHHIRFGSADPLFRSGIGYLTVDWISAFGHIIFLEILLRAEALGFGPKIPRQFACELKDVANPAVVPLLQANGFEFISQPDPMEPRRFQMDYICDPDGKVHYFMDYLNLVQERLLRLGSKPYLKLPESWLEAGDDWLHRLGIGSGAKICLFHCRESTYWTNLYNAFLNSRNASVNAYLDALQLLLKRGYWVIRIGDLGMSRLNLDHHRFKDLSNWTERPDFLDYYLFQRADLFLGTNSGPAGVANVFGRPCLLTNWFPLNVHIAQLNCESLILPKMVRTPCGFASLADMLNDPLSSSDFVETIRGYELMESTSQDLCDATCEIVDRLEGHFGIDPKLQITEDHIQSVWMQHIPWRLNMPHSFLKKYAHILLPNMADGERPGVSPDDWTRLLEETIEPTRDEKAAERLLTRYEQGLDCVLRTAAGRMKEPPVDLDAFVLRIGADIKRLWFEPANAISHRLFTYFANDSLIETVAQRSVRSIGLAPATKAVLDRLDWFQQHFDKVFVGDNFKAGEIHYGQEVLPLNDLLAKQNEIDLFLLTTNTPEIEAAYLPCLPEAKTVSISDLSHPMRQLHFMRSGLARAQRILAAIEASKKPLVVLGNKLLATAEPTFVALELQGYDVFVISLYDKMENQARSGHDASCAVARNALVSPYEQLHILTHMKKGMFWIYYDFFCNVGWDAAKSMVTYASAATMMALASRPVVMGMYDIIKPVCKNMERRHEAFALYKTMLDQADGIALTSKSDHIGEYLRNTLVKDRPVISFYRYSLPPHLPLSRLSDQDGERHLAAVTAFLGEVFEPNRIETRNSIRSILRQRIHFHYYSDHPVVKDFSSSLPPEEQVFFHRETAIWDQRELVHELSRYDGGWLVGDEATIFARLICEVEDRHIRELYTLFVPNGVPTSSMTYGAAGLPVFISRQIKVMEEVYPPGCCIPLDMGEVDNLAQIFQKLDWSAIHRNMRDQSHRFDVFHQIPRLVAFLDQVSVHALEKTRGE